MNAHKARQFGAWWLDRGIFLVASLVAGSAALYSSYDALKRLALFAGWSATAAPGLPLTVDVIALAAGIRYVRLHHEADGRQMAYRGVVWSGVASVTGNAIVHAGITAGWSNAHRVLAVAVSAVPAVALGYVVHLVAAPIVRQAIEAEPEAPEVPEVPAEVPAPEVPVQQFAEAVPLFTEPPRQRRHAKTTGARRGSMKAAGLELMAEADDAGKPLPTTGELSAELGCTARYAQMIHEAWKEKASA